MTEDQAVQGRRRAIALWVVLVGLVIVLAAFVGVARATDSSAFCPTCHEMQPYYAAWEQGPHAEDAQCVDCHVDSGFAARMGHKFVALQEVYAHFFGNRSFPLAQPPEVPNQRCERCHPSVEVKRRNFSHELHAEKAACQNCHFDTGHEVTAEQLKAAGVFNASVVTTRPAFAVAAIGEGRPNIPGHVEVVCSRCHDMAKTGCPACHTPPKDHPAQAAGKNCRLCHAVGSRFVFRHPVGRGDCAELSRGTRGRAPHGPRRCPLLVVPPHAGQDLALHPPAPRGEVRAVPHATRGALPSAVCVVPHEARDLVVVPASLGGRA